MIATIAGKELKAMFSAPLAWVVLTLLQLILSFGFLKRLDDFMQVQAQLMQTPNAPGVTELVVVPVYATCAIIMLFAVPLLAMRLIAEERRNQTMVLLMSAPLTMTEIVLGKFAGLMLFLLLIIGITTLMPLALPLMDSSGASSLKTALLTPFGSLKSKDCGAAKTAVVRVSRGMMWVSFILCYWLLVVLFWFAKEK